MFRRCLSWAMRDMSPTTSPVFYFANGTDAAIVETFSNAVESALSSEEFQNAAASSNFAVQFGNAEEFQKQVTDTVASITPVMEAMGLVTK